MEIKEFKMRVTPEQSRKVQEVLLMNKYDWLVNEKKVKYTEYPFLYFEYSSGVKRFYLLCSKMSGEQFFKEHRLPELTFDEFINLYNHEQQR